MNRNHNKSSVVTTLVVLLVCLVLVTGSTFSLFTSDSKVNIAVTAGDVELTATIDADSLALYSKGEAQTGKFANGGTAAFNDTNTELTLTNITPGDSVEFNIVLENESTVDLQYRVNWIVSGELAEALEATVNGADITSGTSEWTLWKADDTTKSQILELAIELPLEADDNWEELAANIAFNVEAVQANATGEYSHEAFVNTAAGLQAAIASGATEITLNESVELTNTLVIPAIDTPATYSSEFNGVVIDLKRNTITSTQTSGRAIYVEGAAHIKNGNIETANGVGGIYVTGKNASLELTDMNVKVTGTGTNAEWNHAAVGAAGGASLVINNGNYSAETGYGLVVMTSGANVLINDGIFTTGGIEKSAAVRFDSGWDNSKIYTSVIINNGQFNAPDGGFAFTANNAYGKDIAINGGIFNGELDSDYQENGVVINGGTFNKTIFQGGGHEDKYLIKGGTFVEDVTKVLAEGRLVVANAEGVYTVYANTSNTTMTLADGAVLDLGGVEFLGSVKALGDLTIKGDAKFKSLTAINGGTITVEKTLTINGFSFGSSATAGAEYVITGGTITANYGFFQHGVYDLHSNFETGYMYYSYGSDITVYGTFHSQGQGDGLDYVRGKLTIAKGGKSIHDKSLWVGQPAGWGAMSATLIVEEGGYVQANSLSVYEGSAAYNSAANIGVDGVGVKYNSLSGNVNYSCKNGDEITTAISKGATEIMLVGSDTFRLPSNSTSASVKFIGNGEAVLDLTGGSYWDSATLTFEKVNFKTSTGYVTTDGVHFGSDYAALYSKNITYINCSFSGPMRLGRDGASFSGCTFSNLGGDYIWTNGTSVRFDNCTFNTEGKALLLYSDGGNGQPEVSVTNCTFKATQKAYAWAIANMSCAAIEIHNYGYGVDLTTSGNTFDSNFSGEWRIKTYETGRSAIAVNGITYTQTALDGELFTVTNREAAFN